MPPKQLVSLIVSILIVVIVADYGRLLTFLEYQRTVRAAKSKTVAHRRLDAGILNQFRNQGSAFYNGIGIVHVYRWRDEVVFQHEQAMYRFLNTCCA